MSPNRVLLLPLIAIWTFAIWKHHSPPASVTATTQIVATITPWAGNVVIAPSNPLTEVAKWQEKPPQRYATAPRRSETPSTRPQPPFHGESLVLGQIKASHEGKTVNTAVLTPSSLQEGFLWPTTWTYVIQGFKGRHKGVDITRDRDGGYGGGEEAAEIVSTDDSPNAPKVLAAKKGTVTFTGWMGGYGRLVILDHEEGWQTYYGHLSTAVVKKGATVEAGQVLGVMGSTGRSTGTHLHFEIRKDGVPQNPLVPPTPTPKPTKAPLPTETSLPLPDL